jgi:hypothetical protein
MGRIVWVGGRSFCRSMARSSLYGHNVYPLTRAILAHPAATVEGLAVKARALTFAARGRGHVWEAEDVEDLGWDEQVLRDLVDSLLRLAGVDRFGRPLSLTA